MKKRLLRIFVVACMAVMMATVSVSAGTAGLTINGKINYDAMKSVNYDMTYRELAELLLNNFSVEFSGNNLYPDMLLELLDEDFRTTAYDKTTAEYNIEELTLTEEDKDQKPRWSLQEFKDWLSILDRKIDKDTVIKLGYNAWILHEGTPSKFPVDNLKTYINGEEVEFEECYDDWAGAIASNYKVAVETWPSQWYSDHYEDCAYFYFHLGDVEEVVKKTNKPATGDAGNIALYGCAILMAVLATGTAVVVNRKKKEQ